MEPNVFVLKDDRVAQQFNLGVIHSLDRTFELCGEALADAEADCGLTGDTVTASPEGRRPTR